MEQSHNKNIRRTAETAPDAFGNKSSSARPCQALPPEILVNCLADLKQQLALRQAMP